MSRKHHYMSSVPGVEKVIADGLWGFHVMPADLRHFIKETTDSRKNPEIRIHSPVQTPPLCGPATQEPGDSGGRMNEPYEIPGDDYFTHEAAARVSFEKLTKLIHFV